MGGTQLRANVRLKAGENTGSVVLRKTNAPLILCDLLDFSETGFRCLAQVRINDWCDPEKWREMLRPGELFQAEIVYEPFISLLRVSAEIRNSTASGRGYEVGFVFVDVQSDLQRILEKASVEIIAEKLRLLRSEPVLTDSPTPKSQVIAPRLRVSAFTKRPDGAPNAADSSEPRPSGLAPSSVVRFERSEPKLGEVLSRTNVLSRGEVASAVFSAREKGLRLGEYLVSQGVLSPLQLLEARSVQTGLAYIDFDVNMVPIELLNILPIETLKGYDCVPFDSDGKWVRVACANPIPRAELNVLERFCGMRIEIVLCREDLPTKFLECISSSIDQHRRLHPRFKVSMPASFQCCGPDGALLFDNTFPGRITDISEGGMQVVGPVILGLDPDVLESDQLKLIVTIAALPRTIVALCDARHIGYMRDANGGAACVYGLKLDDISPEHYEILQGLIAHVMSSQPRDEESTHIEVQGQQNG